MIWKILEIEKTKDEERIKEVYRIKLRTVNPEDDPEGFKELRRAYEEALKYANSNEDVSIDDVENDKEKTEVDLWIDKIDEIYLDVSKRRDPKQWERILQDSILFDLDKEMEANEALLVYFMTNNYLPQQIWNMIDSRFQIIQNIETLKEKFPEDFLYFLKWQIENLQFMDYDLFQGKLDDNVDAYIETLYAEKAAVSEGNYEEANKLLEKLLSYEIEHPYTEVEKALLLLEESGEKKDLKEEALAIMEELDFQYSNNRYIELSYARVLIENEKINQAKLVYESLIEMDSDNIPAKIGVAKCEFLDKNYEYAKELVENILELDSQNRDCSELLDEINNQLVTIYEEIIKKQPNDEDYLKLGWCFYQLREFKQGIDMLSFVENKETYDYVNLANRLFFANENYEEIVPLAKSWISMIEETKNDGSIEAVKRKNRLSLAYYTLGISLWELSFDDLGRIKDKDQLKNAEACIEKSINMEKTEAYKISYMESLARSYIIGKLYEKAIEVCDRMIAIDDRYFPAYVHRQKANFKLKNAGRVIDDFIACKDLFPEYLVPYYLTSEVFLAIERYDDALEVIKEAEEINSESDGIQFAKIKCLYYQDDSADNLDRTILKLLELKEKIKENKEETDIEDLAEVDRELAIMYWDKDDQEKVLEIVDQYLKENPNSITMLKFKAEFCSRNGENQENLEICQKLNELDPDNLDIKFMMGNAYLDEDEIEEAIHIFENILEKDEDYLGAIRQLMRIYLYLSRREEKLEYINLGISYANQLIQKRELPEWYIQRGTFYRLAYDLEKASEDLKKAIDLEPNSYQAYSELGYVLFIKRNLKETIETLEHVLEKFSDVNKVVYQNLSNSYMIEKRYEDSIRMDEILLEKSSDTDEVFDHIVENYCRKGEFEKAIQIYYKSMEYLFNKTKMSKIIEPLLFMKIKAKIPQLSQANLMFLSDTCVKISTVYQRSGNYDKAMKYCTFIETVAMKNEMLLLSRIMTPIIEFYRDVAEFDKACHLLDQIMNLYDLKYFKETGFDITNDDGQTKCLLERMTMLNFLYASVLYEKGEKKDARKYALKSIEMKLLESDQLEGIMIHKNICLSNLYDLSIMSICAGEIDQAKEYLDMMQNRDLCDFCEYSCCFEKLILLGFISEEEGRYEDAIYYFERVLTIKGNVEFVKNHLKKLKNTL